jgi:hypothetical protein
MSRNIFLDNIPKTYIKKLISKNSSKMSETTSMISTSLKNSKKKEDSIKHHITKKIYHHQLPSVYPLTIIQ